MGCIESLPERRKGAGKRKNKQILGKKIESKERRGQNDRYNEQTVKAKCKIFYKDLRITYSKT